MKKIGLMILELVVTEFLVWLFSGIFIYIGFNFLLPLVFNFVPKLGFFKTCILAVAIDFCSTPIRIPIEIYVKHIVKGA
jgi:hypothetical protein